jgi:hypothetical protein
MEHEQINDKSVALYIKGGKMTARLLADAMKGFLKKLKEPVQKHGKQSLKSLTKQGSALADIEIPGEIGTFKRVARKYNIDFAVKRDDSVKPPNYVVFFKSKDDKAIESAFKEYSKDILKHKDKPSMLKRLDKFKELAKSILPPTKTRSKGEREL